MNSTAPLAGRAVWCSFSIVLHDYINSSSGYIPERFSTSGIDKLFECIKAVDFMCFTVELANKFSKAIVPIMKGMGGGALWDSLIRPYSS